MGILKKLFNNKDTNKTTEDKRISSFVSIFKHVIKWFVMVSFLQVVAVVMVVLMVTLLMIPILSAVTSSETWGNSFDLTNSSLIQSKNANINDYAKYFTMSESDIAKLSSNQDKNLYRFISMCVQLDEKYGFKATPAVVGFFMAEAGGSFYKNGADTKNILEDLSDRRQTGGGAVGPLQLDGNKSGNWEWGGYKPKSLDGLIAENRLTHQYTPYALNWTYNNMSGAFGDGLWKHKVTESERTWKQLGKYLEHYMQVYGVEDTPENRNSLSMMLAYCWHHGSPYAYRNVGERWCTAVAECSVATLAASGCNLDNIRLTATKWTSEATKGPFFGTGFGTGKTMNHDTIPSGYVDYTLTVNGQQINKSLLGYLRDTYSNTQGSTINETIYTLNELKKWQRKTGNTNNCASAIFFDAMQSPGTVFVGYAVMRDLLEKLGIDADFSGENEEDSTEIIIGDLPPQYYQSNYTSSYKGAKKEDFFGSIPYGTGRNATVAYKGCGPTCGAMIVSWAKKQRITPKDVIDWCGNRYYNKNGGGSDGKALFSNLAKKYGLKYVQIGPYHSKASKKDAEKAYEYLKQGIPLISNQNTKADPNNIFTRGGHFIVLAGLNSDGTIKVYDPNAKNAFTKGYNTRNFTLDEIAKGCRAYFAFVP